MNYLNALPLEIQDLIYEFDGRYNIAKGKCLQIIKEMGIVKQKRNDYFSSEFDIETYHSRCPNYYAEIERRVAKYRGLMENGHIRGITTHLKRIPKMGYKFKDALGYYLLGTCYDTLFVNNVAYKSTEKIYTVVMMPICQTRFVEYKYTGTHTVVKRIDVLDPVFIKSIKTRGKKRDQLFRDLGVSENGVPGKDVYFEAITIDGNDYILENRTMSVGGIISKTRTSRALGFMDRFGEVFWYTERPGK